MSEHRPGYYKDKNGDWQKDRRTTNGRRSPNAFPYDHEQRKQFRRKADRELYEMDHKQHIKEALEDFAEEHDGHL
tara:strand:- start:422 stop:646 length:225 start_codon:yes stop_codon:yes gene_type:complete